MNDAQKFAFELRLDALRQPGSERHELTGGMLAACSAHDPEPEAQTAAIIALSNNLHEPHSDTGTSQSPCLQPGTGLATWAVVLAIALGLSPLGADILFVASQFWSVTTYAGLVALFFVVIMTPVVLLYRVSGFAGFVAAPIRMTMTVLILVLFLFFHIASIIHLAQ